MLKRTGFTLAELLIALAILGVIAVFAIPKVLSSQQDGKYKSMAKEAAATLSEAYQALQTSGAVSSSTRAINLTPYLNYVRQDTVGSFHDAWGSAYPCSGSDVCYVIHNGGTLALWNNMFNGTANVNFIEAVFDPDGGGPVRGVWYHLYYNGRIATLGTCLPGATNSGGSPACPFSGGDPTWFNWN